MRTTFVVPENLDHAPRDPTAPAPGRPIPPHSEVCFGCGPNAVQGLHLQMIADTGIAAHGEMPVRPWHEGGPGVIHGGLLSAAFDEAMGQCLMLSGLPIVTAVLDVDYAKPVPIGSVLRLRAELLGVARRKVYAHAQAYVDDADEPAAASHGMFVVIDPVAHFGAQALAGRTASGWRTHQGV